MPPRAQAAPQAAGPTLAPESYWGTVMNMMKAGALALTLAFAAGTVALPVMADPAQTQRTEAEDLYHRGFYDQAMAKWTEQAAKGDAVAAYHLGVEYMD